MNILTGELYESMVRSAFKNMKINYETINSLNVFPVPDGDTGTNMTATLQGGIAAMEKEESTSLSNKAKSLARGMLFSARGNSGVITSQFFSGISDGLDGKETATPTEFLMALESGVKKAYKAVDKPVEGTILTVAREGVEEAEKEFTPKDDLEALLSELRATMDKALQKTPSLLPVLKEAGVIDSGGAGLVTIIEGMLCYLLGKELENRDFKGPTPSVDASKEIPFDENSVLDYGYCTEFILQLLKSKESFGSFALNDFIAKLEELGDSIVALQDGTVVKVHIHTKTPGKVLDLAQVYGEFVTFKMENMSIQHKEVLLKEIQAEPKKKHGIVAVAPSKEIGEVFEKFGVDYIVYGGQTMNPSAIDFTKAFEAVNAEEILVFPNNGNVILTAEQAGELYKDSKIAVVPCKSFCACFSLLQILDIEDQSIEDAVEDLKEHLKGVSTYEVTRAIRDTVNNGTEVAENDYILIHGGNIIVSKPTLKGCLKEFFSDTSNFEGKSVLTVFYGKDADRDDRAHFAQFASNIDEVDFVEIEANQDVYPFAFSLE